MRKDEKFMLGEN